MPSEAKEGDYEYKDNLDQVQEIIQKYDNSYQIIICGDMNASLHRDDRRRDNLFRNCIHENGLKLANNQSGQPFSITMGSTNLKLTIFYSNQQNI